MPSIEGEADLLLCFLNLLLFLICENLRMVCWSADDADFLQKEGTRKTDCSVPGVKRGIAFY